MIRKSVPKELFAESFRERCARKPASKITVREIVNNCEYSAATFYREFKDKYDLIEWDYTQRVADIMRKVGGSGYPWNRSLIEGAEFYQEQRPYILNLLQHTSGRDAFRRCMIDKNYAALRECVARYAGSEGVGTETDLCIRLYCSGTVDLCCEWLGGVFSAEPAEIATVWESSLPQPLKPFLYASA